MTAEEQNRVAFVNVPPSFSLVMNSDMVIYMFLQAEDADHHSVVMGNLVMPHAMENPMFEHLMKFNADSVSEIVSQDLHVDEMVQQGSNRNLRRVGAIHGRRAHSASSICGLSIAIGGPGRAQKSGRLNMPERKGRAVSSGQSTAAKD